MKNTLMQFIVQLLIFSQNFASNCVCLFELMKYIEILKLAIGNQYNKDICLIFNRVVSLELCIIITNNLL